MDEPQRKRSKMGETFVNDIVHGIINLPDYIREIVDTTQFQRLRFVNQLGFVLYVYPSASYSRFEHSIGAFHLASKLIRKIQMQLENEAGDIRITEEELKCVEIAALCHDLGHGPYSHFWEHAFDDSLNIKIKKHEELSKEIFLDIVTSKKRNHGKPLKDEINLSERMIELIQRIIMGDYNEDLDGKKAFLFEIVANKKSGIDVDKFDHLCRDSIYLGWSNKNKINDIKRLFHFFRAVKDDREETWHLAMRDREIFNVHDIFYYRHLIHRYGVQHKNVKSVECMIRKALKNIFASPTYREELLKNVFGKPTQYKSKVWFSKDFISRVCDYHIWDIVKKYNSNIINDIEERNLYKLHCQIHIKEINDNNNNNNTRQDIAKLQSFLNKKLINVDIKLELSNFALQSETTGNPLLSVKFYKKHNPKKLFVFEESTLPDLVKLKSKESILTVFTDKSLDKDNIKKFDVIKRKLCRNDYLDNDVIHDLRSKYTFKEINY